MALQLQNCCSFDMNNFKQFDSNGTPVFVSSPVSETSSLRALELADAEWVDFILIEPDPADNFRKIPALVDNNHVFGFKFNPDHLAPSATTDICEVWESNSQILILQMNTSGELLVLDANGSQVGSAWSTGLTADTYHKIEIYLQNNGSGNLVVHVDGVERINASSVDMLNSTAGADLKVRFKVSTSPSFTWYLDHFYWFSGATGISDALGDWKVKMYQGDGNTSEGTALDTGSWANAQEHPFNNSNEAEYTQAGPVSGAVETQGGTRAGPNGDSEVGAIHGAKAVAYLQRGNGGGTTHSFHYGNSGDGRTSFNTGQLQSGTNTGVWQVMTGTSGAAGDLPTTSEYFLIGMGVDGPRDIQMHEAHADCVITPPAADTDFPTKQTLLGVGV